MAERGWVVESLTVDNGTPNRALHLPAAARLLEQTGAVALSAAAGERKRLAHNKGRAHRVNAT